MALLDIKELESFSPVFRGKAGNALGRALMRILSVDRINGLYDRHSGQTGPDFARDVLADIGLEWQLGLSKGAVSQYEALTGCDACGKEPLEILDGILPHGPFITVSNHPCGHVDGIALVDIFGHLRPGYKVMVNKILSRIRPLEPNFIPVTPTGAQRTAPTVDSVAGIKAALSQLRCGRALGLFPSGAVSDLSLKERRVRDREWQEAVVRLIHKAKVPVVPVRFFDGNSPFYYSLGLIDWRVRLLRLPSEVFNKAGQTMRMGIGPLITVQEQGVTSSVADLRNMLRASVYDMELSDCIW